MKKLLIILLTSLLVTTTKAGEPKCIINFEQKNFVDTIPIKFFANRILMKAEVNGKPYTFLFDTGCSRSVVFDTTLVVGKKIKTKKGLDATNRIFELTCQTIPHLRIGNLTASNITCYTDGEGIINKFMRCSGITGIIGADLINKRFLKIDTQSGYMILTDLKKFFNTKCYTHAGTLVSRHANSYFNVIINKKKKLPYILFDTGSPAFLTINHKKREQLKKKNKGIDTFASCLKAKSKGLSTIGVTGVSDCDSVRVYIMDSVKIAGLTFKNAPVANTNGSTSLGANLLNFCSVIMDNKNWIVYLKPFTPNKDSKYSVKGNSITFPIKPLKLYPTLFPVNGEWIIGIVWPNSCISNLNPEIGDKLIMFDDKPVKDVECEIGKSKTFSENNHKLTFMKKDGSTYSYTVEERTQL
jgi:hypothetical protein